MAVLPLIEELNPAPDPLSVAEHFLGQPGLLFLDSAADPERLGRYSFLSADPARVIRTRGPAGPGPTALEAARALLDPFRSDPVPGLPPFQGGVAGYLAYDYGAVLERLPAPRYDDLQVPDAMLGLYDWVIAWDHRAGRAWVISTGVPAEGAARPRRAAERLAWVLRHLAGPAPGAAGRHWSPGHGAGAAPKPAPSYPVMLAEDAAGIGLRSSFTHRGYLDAVARVREYIIAGDIFQANLSQRLEAPLEEDPWHLYRRLRAVNPAPFAAYLEGEGLAVASASPERFLRVDPEGRVETRPIKGTRPRGLSPQHDAALSRSLRESGKDRAENLMIVDLLRNDLSRVCRPGSVRVPELFALEGYRTVHHLVSTVVGELAAGRNAIDLLAATFPGGSITGAPKVRAMEIIAELEPSRRGVYCGSIGYLSLTGAMDTSIVIRTLVAAHGRVTFSVGGGIVADSDPELEYQETLDKGRALIAALAGGVTTP